MNKFYLILCLALCGCLEPEPDIKPVVEQFLQQKEEVLRLLEEQDILLRSVRLTRFCLGRFA